MGGCIKRRNRHQRMFLTQFRTEMEHCAGGKTPCRSQTGGTGDKLVESFEPVV